MSYYYPFGEKVHPLVQQDRTPKKVFVLGVYASAVHGDIPIKQFLGRVAHIDYFSLQEYVDLFGYGNKSEVVINGQAINVLPLAHPSQIGALGSHSVKWNLAHIDWEKKR